MSHLNNGELPDGVEPQWAAHVIATYTDENFVWSNGNWQLPDDERRAVLEVFKVAGHPLSRSEIVAAGVGENQLRYLSRMTDALSGDPTLRRIGSGRKALFAPLECHHCGGTATHSMVTPETRPGVLCPSCWRSPQADSPIFPEWYRSDDAVIC
jgi:hypothetical protein